MKTPRILAPSLALLMAGAAIAADKPGPSKKVLVELFTSQGCDSCPSANEFLGQMAGLGYGPDRVVPIAYHVDYFNTPWLDPFSNADFSRREMAYNSVLRRNDLYFTPMMMVDGRAPMLGSDRPEAFKALKKATADKPGVDLELSLAGTGPGRSLSVEVRPITPEVQGRTMMVAVSLTEGPITTAVKSGENAGKSLVEPFVARSFAFQKAKLGPKDPLSLSFPITIPADSVEARCRVAAFVQDWDTGKVYQAASVPVAVPTKEAAPRP